MALEKLRYEPSYTQLKGSYIKVYRGKKKRGEIIRSVDGTGWQYRRERACANPLGPVLESIEAVKASIEGRE